jgi:hypothetical protein
MPPMTTIKMMSAVQLMLNAASGEIHPVCPLGPTPEPPCHPAPEKRPAGGWCGQHRSRAAGAHGAAVGGRYLWTPGKICFKMPIRCPAGLSVQCHCRAGGRCSAPDTARAKRRPAPTPRPGADPAGGAAAIRPADPRGGVELYAGVRRPQYATRAALLPALPVLNR